MAPAPVRDVPLGQHQVPVDASTAETASEDTALFQEIALLKEEVLTIEEVFKEENHQLKQAIARLQQQVDDGTVAATASMSEPHVRRVTITVTWTKATAGAEINSSSA